MATVSELRITARRRQKDGSLQIEIKSLPVQAKRLQNQRQYAGLYADQIAFAGGLKATRIDILLDSHGGAVHSALGLIHALQSGRIGKVPKRVLVTGLCGSAATLMLGMGAPVYIVPTGRVYVHAPKLAREAPAGFLGRLRERIGTDETVRLMVSVYRGRTKSNRRRLKRETVLDWMRGTGTYFSAAEAVEVGLADGVMTREDFEKR